MKTNQEMVRKMGEFDVIQRTVDGFFNASELMRQWNVSKNQSKSINHYLDNTSTKRFIQAIIDDDKEIRNSEKPINQIYVKKNSKTDKNGNKQPGEVWMSPIMFIDYAMWINPAFKVKVLKFVSDQMLYYRNEAGEAYKKLASAISAIVSKDFMPKAMQKVGEALNWVVFNSHEKMLRNKHGDEAKQRELWQLERKVADLIEEGFISDFDSVVNYLRKKYCEKRKVFMLS